MERPDAITELIRQLRAEDPEQRNAAAQQIWQAYFPRLLKLAEAKIDQRIRTRADEEDVLQSMYKSFCLRQQRGDFSLANRDELWHVLVVITQRKIRNLAKHHRRQRRDYHRDEAPAAAEAESSAQWPAFEQLGDSQPTPEEAAVLSEEMERRMRLLADDLQQIALWKLEGYTNEEIAGPEMLDCAVRTVERKLARIRKAWDLHEGED